MWEVENKTNFLLHENHLNNVRLFYFKRNESSAKAAKEATRLPLINQHSVMEYK